MDIEEALQDESNQPLLDPEQFYGITTTNNNKDATIPAKRARQKAFESTAHLANHLPTGTVLTFQILSPIFTNEGQCSVANQTMTAYLVALCALSCFILSLTDSIRDEAGNVRHGIATWNGLWIIDGTEPLPTEMTVSYRIMIVDFIHAITAVMVFAAVTLLDHNVVLCFYPILSEETKQMLTMLPVAIGVIASMLFVNFPTTRHGIGFPLSTQ
ncbi:uncharacterized protein A4U43_C01F18790 [Asparagus officinalis]|uniref:Uncharacterized protein n=1 Tax=Asparagus officinalis TaxID=4686 RepID=A0A5P1FS63_ASPOF|nr:uncharacterized protein LOC109835408 [Asparagus officinalis]ONK80523.1 uncharacterized protein A4U43_C01F18790 [Asparagus officinalis]